MIYRAIGYLGALLGGWMIAWDVQALLAAREGNYLVWTLVTRVIADGILLYLAGSTLKKGFKKL